MFLGALLLCGVCDQKRENNVACEVSRSSSALWCLRPGPGLMSRPCRVSRSSSALWCLRPPIPMWMREEVVFLGALLLCGVCDRP